MIYFSDHLVNKCSRLLIPSYFEFITNYLSIELLKELAKFLMSCHSDSKVLVLPYSPESPHTLLILIIPRSHFQPQLIVSFDRSIVSLCNETYGISTSWHFFLHSSIPKLQYRSHEPIYICLVSYHNDIFPKHNRK